MTKFVFRIAGMDCAEESALLRRALSNLPGVQDVACDVVNGKLLVTVQDGTLTDGQIITAVAQTGLTAAPWREAESEAIAAPEPGRWSRTALTFASGALLGTGLAIVASSGGWRAILGGSSGPPVCRILYVASVLSGLWTVLPKAWLAVRRLRPDMNLLMVVAVVGAIGIGEFVEAATVAFLFALSAALERWSVGRARHAIAALMAVAPTRARVLGEDGLESQVGVQEVAIGSRLLIKPGEKFPLDGRILKGETTVNQAPITGESLPVSKATGEDVFAGTINETGTIEIVTTKTAQDTTLARIIHMVGDAQSKRSPSEQWVERFAAWYTPVVLGLALAVAILPPLVLGGGWSRWFYEGLVLLVIGCPCALVISTPVSIVAAMTSAARRGILVKGGPYIEVPGRLKAIALDKTGTITQGRPEVQRVVPLSGHSERELLEIAAAIERQSQHPLAVAIVRYAEECGIQSTRADNFQSLAGRGGSAMVAGQQIWIGSHRYLEERGQETADMHSQLEAFANNGWSAVVVGKEHHVCGLIAVADSVRGNASDAIAAMRSVGLERIVMLTGDNRDVAEHIARQVGIDQVHAELLPEDKVRVIQDLVKEFGQVAMIGDGVNDAPALAASSLGIAMGAAGTDAAIETADVALMSDDLSRVAWLIGHSRGTLTIIRQNIFASLAVKGIFVALTVAGSASLWSAIAADMGVSLAVVFNALRLLRSKAK
ncbi:MAG: cadmium-translocating P-type ATPase [Planctomycetes bacterium]|nr:cadmium-translocating P-type ATPase [Planctomycetota bacterium]